MGIDRRAAAIGDVIGGVGRCRGGGGREGD